MLFIPSLVAWLHVFPLPPMFNRIARLENRIMSTDLGGIVIFFLWYMYSHYLLIYYMFCFFMFFDMIFRHQLVFVLMNELIFMFFGTFCILVVSPVRLPDSILNFFWKQ